MKIANSISAHSLKTHTHTHTQNIHNTSSCKLQVANSIKHRALSIEQDEVSYPKFKFSQNTRQPNTTLKLFQVPYCCNKFPINFIICSISTSKQTISWRPPASASHARMWPRSHVQKWGHLCRAQQ